MIDIPIRGGNYRPETWEWEQWKLVYERRGVDIEYEAEKARQWVLANPKNKKKNGKMFLVNWFNRASENPQKGPNGVSSKYRDSVDSDFRRRQAEHDRLPCNESHAYAELAKVKKLLGMRP